MEEREGKKFAGLSWHSCFLENLDAVGKIRKMFHSSHVHFAAGFVVAEKRFGVLPYIGTEY